jgi:prolyl-tRNA editing enzyme YbaK/EbsC (Cys-tRNA(Pro) deacylase)
MIARRNQASIPVDADRRPLMTLPAPAAIRAPVMDQLPESARRVAAAAAAAGLAVNVVEMPDSTRTAEEAARACGCEVAQIVKSLVFVGAASGQPYLLLVSGANRVDEMAVAAELGEPLVRPDGRRVREITGYAIGGIPPIGHPEPMRTLIDAKLLEYDVVWAAAGTPRCVFAADPAALARAASATTYAF